MPAKQDWDLGRPVSCKIMLPWSRVGNVLDFGKGSFSSGTHCIYIYFNLFILFLAALGLHCCAQAFSSCSEQGLLFVAVHGLLTAVASLVAEHGF